MLRERGAYTVIDGVTVVLNTKNGRYKAEFSNRRIKKSQSVRIIRSSMIVCWQAAFGESFSLARRGKGDEFNPYPEADAG